MPVMSLVKSADAIACKRVEGALKESVSSDISQNMQVRRGQFLKFDKKNDALFICLCHH